LAALVLVLETTPPGFAQKGGKRGGGGGPDGGGPPGGGFPGGGKMKMKMDPDAIFEFASQGKGYIAIDSMRMGKEQAEEFAKKEGIKDGKLTREQFMKYMEEQKKNWQQKFGPGGAPGDEKGGPGGKGFGKGGPGGKGKGNWDPEDLFKRYDINGDGFLNEDEIGQMRGPWGSFKEEWQKWDKNKDSKISLEEWKPFVEARQKEFEARREAAKKDADKKDGDKKESITRVEIEEIDNTIPVVWRANFLPKELPPWFKELDTNNDGQVSLMEWMKAGKPMSEFAKYDRNDDGLLTPEEVLRAVRLAAGLPANGEAVAANGDETERVVGPRLTSDKTGKFGKGGFGKGGFGKGGFGKGGKGGFDPGQFDPSMFKKGGKGGKGGGKGRRGNQDDGE
jgi:Ca2+-binding EF-hand superfamily protein